MSGTPITLRMTLNDTPVDTPSVGEPFLNLKDNKFGIWNGTTMLWYPGLDPITETMILNVGQKLSGYDSTGTSTVNISFNTPNAITFTDLTGAILAQFDSTGASFNSFSTIPPIAGGILNRFIHPGFIPSLYPTNFVTVDNNQLVYLGPNTAAFRTQASMGTMQIRAEYVPGAGAQTHLASEAFTLRVRVLSTLGSGGIRMWLMEPGTGYFGDVSKNQNRVYISILGPLGKTSYIRIGRNGSYNYKSITGSGGWKREFIDVPQHSSSSDFVQNEGVTPYSVDVLYNAEVGDWAIAEPTMQCIDQYSNEIYQYRSLAARMANANMVYFEPVGYMMHGTDHNYINLPVQMPAYSVDFYDYTIETIDSTYPIVITEKTGRGFEAHTDEDNASFWKFKPRIIMHGQISDIA